MTNPLANRRCESTVKKRGPSSREIAAPNDPQVSCPGRFLSMAQFVYLVHHAQALAGGNRPYAAALDRGAATGRARRAGAGGTRREACSDLAQREAARTANGRSLAAAGQSVCDLRRSAWASAGRRPGHRRQRSPRSRTRDVLLASHMPLLPALLHRLTTGRHDRLSAPFPLNGCVALERAGELWQERWTSRRRSIAAEAQAGRSRPSAMQVRNTRASRDTCPDT